MLYKCPYPHFFAALTCKLAIATQIALTVAALTAAAVWFLHISCHLHYSALQFTLQAMCVSAYAYMLICACVLLVVVVVGVSVCVYTYMNQNTHDSMLDRVMVQRRCTNTHTHTYPPTNTEESLS